LQAPFTDQKKKQKNRTRRYRTSSHWFHSGEQFQWILSKRLSC